jgi:lysophospholipase L1-like esterase
MPEALMQFVWFCASGESFFLGTGLLVLAAVLPLTPTVKAAATLSRVLIVIGFVLMLLAAIPLSPVFYVTLMIGSVLLFFAPRPGQKRRWVHRAGQASVVILALAGMASEVAFHARVGQPHGSSLWVIGDSVSAGIQGPNEKPWPDLLARDYGIEVVNLAESGATVASAIGQAERVADDAQLVLLEIGGNDFFAPTPPKQFRQDLIHLLEQVVRPNRTVVLLELPVLPWDVQYGRIQRQVAKSFDVVIVPKRFFASVLRRPGSTLDLAHLSSLGHERMADQVAHLLGLAKPTG